MAQCTLWINFPALSTILARMTCWFRWWGRHYTFVVNQKETLSPRSVPPKGHGFIMAVQTDPNHAPKVPLEYNHFSKGGNFSCLWWHTVMRTFQCRFFATWLSFLISDHRTFFGPISNFYHYKGYRYVTDCFGKRLYSGVLAWVQVRYRRCYVNQLDRGVETGFMCLEDVCFSS